MPVIAVAPGDLSLKGPQQSVTGSFLLVGVSVLAFTATAPVLALDKTVPVGAATLGLTGTAPTVSTGSTAVVMTPDAASLGVTGYVPTVLDGTNHLIVVPTGTLTFKGPANDSPTIAVGTVVLGFTGTTPLLTFQLLSIPPADVRLTGTTPTVLISTVGIAVPAGALTFAGTFPSQSFKGPDFGPITITGTTPLVSIGTVRQPGAGALTATGLVPRAQITAVSSPAAVALVLTGTTPGVLTAHKALPAQGPLAFTGQIPQVVLGSVTSPTFSTPQAALGLTGLTPALLVANPIPVPAGNLTATGRAPALIVVGVTQTIAVSVGRIVVTPTAPVTNFFYVISPGVGRLRFAGPQPVLAGPDVGTGVPNYPAWQAVILTGSG